MSQDAEIKPYQLPEGFREDFTLEQEELSFVPPPRKLPSHLQQQAKDSNFNPDKLRRLGVQFPDFFCELCCREYANRYFLRTHKWKRHGLFVPPEDVAPQPGSKDEAQMASAWPFMPLNLMLAKAAAATMDQQEQEREPEVETDSEQPSKRIKLEQGQTPPEGYDEDKLNGSVVGLQNLQKLQSMLQWNWTRSQREAEPMRRTNWRRQRMDAKMWMQKRRWAMPTWPPWRQPCSCRYWRP